MKRFITLSVLLCSHIGFPAWLTSQSLPQNIQAEEVAEMDTISASRSGIDTSIYYTGGTIEYDLKNEIVHLTAMDDDLARVEYRDMTLEAHKIRVNLDSMMLYAEGVEDTAHLLQDGTYPLKNTPIFKQQGRDPVSGRIIMFNLKNQKGRVIAGRTKFENGYYYGDRITKTGKDLFQIEDCIFTTCDQDSAPHFFFKADKMKMKLDDKVVVKPITAYIAGVPVGWFPFAVFSIRRGRQSGVIFPTWGTSLEEGRYIRGLGYYWAPNDYMDTKMLVDFFEKTGFLFRGDIRYAKRYQLGGNISGSFTRKNFLSGREERLWDLQLQHTQELSPTMRLTMHGKFASNGSFYKNLSLDRQQRVQRELISDAAFYKSFPDAKNNLTVNLRRRHDLELGSIQQTLPQISFSHTQPIYLTGTDSDKRGQHWYSDMNFRYSSNLTNRYSKTRNTTSDKFQTKTRSGVSHNISFLAPMRVFRHLNLSPQIDYREEWFQKTRTGEIDNDGQLLFREKSGFAARRTFNTGATLTTKIYGMFTPAIGSVQAVRHVITPSVSFTYRPDFSSSFWGYYQSAQDSIGNDFRYDRFGDVVFGGTSTGKRESINLSLRNLFQVKTLKEDQENKFDLFNANFSTSYNAAAEEFRWADIRTSFRTMKFLDLDVSAAHSLYQFDREKGRPVNKFISGFPRLVNFQTTMNFRLTGGRGGGTEDEQQIPETDEFTKAVTARDQQERFLKDDKSPPMSIPWDLSTGLRYNLSQFNPDAPRKTIAATLNMSLNLTSKWKVDYRTEIDLHQKRLIYQDFSFYRDLHCWEFRFNWTPTGYLEGYYFILRIKAPQFKDLKVEKRDYGGSVLGRY